MIHRIAGQSLILFSAVMLLETLLTAIFLDACFFDLALVVFIVIGLHVKRQSRRAMKWGIGLMAFWLLLSVFLLGVILLQPENIRLPGRLMGPDLWPWLVARQVLVTAWAAVNVGLLVWSLRLQPVSVANGTETTQSHVW